MDHFRQNVNRITLPSKGRPEAPQRFYIFLVYVKKECLMAKTENKKDDDDYIPPFKP